VSKQKSRYHVCDIYLCHCIYNHNQWITCSAHAAWTIANFASPTIFSYHAFIWRHHLVITVYAIGVSSVTIFT